MFHNLGDTPNGWLCTGACIINGYITLTVRMAFYPQSSAPLDWSLQRGWLKAVRFRSLLPPDGLQGNSAADVTSVYPPSM